MHPNDERRIKLAKSKEQYLDKEPVTPTERDKLMEELMEAMLALQSTEVDVSFIYSDLRRFEKRYDQLKAMTFPSGARMRPIMFQSSAADVVQTPETKEKFQKYYEELKAIGARISHHVHDEVFFDCVPGTEDQVKAIHDKYFPQEKMSEEKRQKLEAAGWKVGSVEEFLKSPSDEARGWDDPVVKIQCTACHEQKECLLVCVYVPTPPGKGDDGGDYEEDARWGICKECLKNPVNAMTLARLVSESIE